VTGAASGAGLLLTRHLLDRADVGRVVAIDTVRGDAAGATWRLADVTDPAVARRLAGVDVLVHLATDLSFGADASVAAQRSARNVRGAQAVLTAAAAAGVRRVVMVTSAMVYGALADNPVPLAEDAPLRAVPDRSVVGDLLEIESVAARAREVHPGLSVTVVRPVTVVGAGVDSVLTRHFESPRLLVVRGSRPRWQFCHVDDLVSALTVVVVRELDGPLTVASGRWLEQEEVEAASGLGRIELPAGVAFGTAERLHRLGMVPAPASELAYVVYPWVVDSARLLATGWQPAYDGSAALERLLADVAGHHALAARRLGRTDATIGAAGATVAVLGTAALVRRARRRRGR
jgi:nucleoside-diphosphate-sugar epimerase